MSILTSKTWNMWKVLSLYLLQGEQRSSSGMGMMMDLPLINTEAMSGMSGCFGAISKKLSYVFMYVTKNNRAITEAVFTFRSCQIFLTNVPLFFVFN